MVYKIVLEEGFSNHIKELRDLDGDYNHEVFFWDIVLDWKYDQKENLIAYLETKLSSEDMNKFKIIEVKE